VRKNNQEFDISDLAMYTLLDYERKGKRKMKVCVIQPEYSVDWSRSDELFRREIELLHQCDESMDLIVMPEYSDIPCKASTLEEDRVSVSRYTDILIKECCGTAKRCNPLSAHHEYIEIGCRAWKYRPAGSAIVRYDAVMPYPRVCAQRGFSAVAPENSLAAFGAAVAMGAEKVQFFKPYINRKMIERAHENGIRCNVFFADTKDEAVAFLKLGADTVLTNDYNLVAQAVKEYKKNEKRAWNITEISK